jgi:ABC-type nitrate/sulfonate/bicarbonate transport system permease component
LAIEQAADQRSAEIVRSCGRGGGSAVKTGRNALWLIASFAVGCAFIGLWQLIANAKLVSPVFLPGPDRAWSALVSGFAFGDLDAKLLGTVRRMIVGWFLASLAGIALGAIIGISKTARAYLQPTLEFLRPLPSSAVIPVAIALFGRSELMVLSAIGFGALLPTLLATIHGFSAVEPRLYEVSASLDCHGLRSFVRSHSRAQLRTFSRACV